MKKNGFHGRGLTSLIVVSSFLIMTITGIVLYFVPHGRVAYWVNWQFIWLTKTDWINIHVISSIAFVVAGSFHIYFNWKSIMNYLTGKIAGALKYRKELGITCILSIFIIAGSIYLIPPLNYVIDFSEYLKNSWTKSREYEPPFGHAEEVSLKIFAKKMDIDLSEAIKELRANGITLKSAKKKLKDIAQKNNITPMDIYVVIKKYEKKAVEEGVIFTPELVEEKFAGTGIGRKALSWILEDIGIDSELAKQRLSKNNIQADEEETLKEIAQRYGINPIDVLKIILVEDYSFK